MYAYRSSNYRTPYEVRASLRFTGKVYCVDVEIRSAIKHKAKWQKAHQFRCKSYKMAQQAHVELNEGLIWINPVFSRPADAKGL